jgi:outer membrane protein OmpA-like peptidoglycan-associated protein
MKKAIIIISLILVITMGLFIGYLLFTDKMMIQLPVLVQKNPKITFVFGNAWYKKTPSDRWEILIVGQELKNGYEVKTDKNSQIDIRFHGSMAIRVSEETTIQLDDMTVKKMLLLINRGSIYGKFEKIFKDYSIQIKTPTTIAAVRGTELGFEIEEMTAENEKDKLKKKHDEKKEPIEEEAVKAEPVYSTTVYSLSGITELYNKKFEDQKMLLSYQNKTVIRENEPPADTEKMNDEEILKIRSKLNSIHTEEVLLISDKINFETGSATILPDSYAELDKIVKILNEKGVQIRIEGHTDIQGTAAFNQTLSKKRANSIREYFIKKGIDPEQMGTAGYGSSKPVADNSTKEGRALNRRVEFIVIEK